MASVFTSIINGDIPARFIWQDDVCVAFFTHEPLHLGHTLVVPRAEVEDWMSATPELFTHCATVAQRIGLAQQAVWNTPRIGLLAEGYGVAHLHLHVFPAPSSATFDFKHRMATPSSEHMDEAARQLREQLRTHGYGPHVPQETAAAAS